MAKKIIYLKPILSSDRENAKKEPAAKGNQSDLNPNAEIAYKPFTEKLAMFRKVDTEEEVVTVDMEKCK